MRSSQDFLDNAIIAGRRSGEDQRRNSGSRDEIDPFVVDRSQHTVSDKDLIDEHVLPRHAPVYVDPGDFSSRTFYFPFSPRDLLRLPSPAASG